MICEINHICGGCPLRHLNPEEYQSIKTKQFDTTIGAIHQSNIPLGKPIFIPDGQRRRAELTFSWQKKHLLLGFNAYQSHDIANLQHCAALTAALNNILPDVRNFLTDFCAIQTHKKIKNKIQTSQITQGEIWLTAAENGIDILLETEAEIELEYRILISEWMQNTPAVIRFSAARKNKKPETIIEKTAPFINIDNHKVFISAGTFLQPSVAGERALIDLVLKYIGNTTGNIADLFCGIGTFSYPLSQNIKNKILAVDSSAESLNNFQKTVNALKIPNIKIEQKNLFKYALDAHDLKNFSAVVFDPPRAGAQSQTKQLAALPQTEKPQKIVAISCNPQTFVNDANTLIAGGYQIKEITMVDQFVYTRHCELVALFEI
jgi:23S rRNA (uracil1939-C5)-methyltransferase